MGDGSERDVREKREKGEERKGIRERERKGNLRRKKERC